MYERENGGAAEVAVVVEDRWQSKAVGKLLLSDLARERRARYLMWTLPLESSGISFETHHAFLLREPDGSVRAVHDVHREGWFSRATWLRLFGEVGLVAELAPRKTEGGEYDSFIASHEAP